MITQPTLDGLGAAAKCSSRRSSVRRVVKPLPEFPERFEGGGRRDLSVDLHRDGDLAVPQDLHGNTRMHIERCQQGGHRDAAIEAPVKVARLDRW